MPSATYSRIYEVVARIPEGRVATYGQVAALAGLGRRARQVGYALHSLPEGTGLPWQRVINARGEVSLRAEGGREGYQRFLLEEEGVVFDAAGRIDLARFRWDPDGESPRPGRRSAGKAGRQAGKADHPPRGDRAGGNLETEVESILAALRPLGAARRAAGEKAYLKSDLDFLGIDTPTMRRQARAWLKARAEIDRRTLLPLAKALWRRSIHELRAFAIELLLARRDELEPADLVHLEWMLRRSASWAYVDAIAVHVAGPLVERHPRLAAEIDRWSVDADFWLRRSALLALLLPLRRGAGDWRRFAGFADAMLDERELFIRKAIGWVLREVGKKRPELVRDFVAARAGRIAGLTLREAVKYLPARDRGRLLGGVGQRKCEQVK